MCVNVNTWRACVLIEIKYFNLMNLKSGTGTELLFQSVLILLLCLSFLPLSISTRLACCVKHPSVSSSSLDPLNTLMR